MAALVWFSIVGWFQTDAFGTWHEELSVHSSIPSRVLEQTEWGESVTMRPARCSDSSGELLVWSGGRPLLTACLWSHSMPVMVESYFSGLFYWPAALLWPIHHGDAFILRKLMLAIGLIGLLLTFALVSRLRDETTAALVVVATATSSPFVSVHAFLVHYEVLPWMFLSVALLLVGPRRPTNDRRRIVLAALSLGLGCLANVKMLLLVAPLAALVVARRRDWLRSIDRRTWVVAGLAGLAGSSPLWLTALFDPNAGVAAQTSRRLSTMLERADPSALPAELVNELTFGADFGSYLVSGGTTHPLLLVPGALATTWTFVHLVRWLARRDADPLGVLCGATLGAYLFVSLLLYDQTPAANYGPLHSVFGMALGGAAAAAGRRLARAVPALRAGVAGAAIVLLLALGSTAVLVWRMDAASSVPLPINATAQKELGEYLRSQDPSDRTFISTTYNLAGVIESLSRGRLSPVQAHLVLDPCLREERDLSEACLTESLGRIIDATGSDDISVLAPARASPIDEPSVDRILPALERAAAARRWTVADEASFATSRGAPVLTIRRLRRAGSDR